MRKYYSWTLAVLFVVTAFLSTVPVRAADTVTVSPSVTHQTIGGWVGVLPGNNMSSFQTSQLISREVNELGLTAFRFDDPFNGNGPARLPGSFTSTALIPLAATGQRSTNSLA